MATAGVLLYRKRLGNPLKGRRVPPQVKVVGAATAVAGYAA